MEVNTTQRDYGGKGRLAFYNYESFVDKFNAEAPKTTDDCYTPADVFDAVVNFVGTLIDLENLCIVRPFYPGGDYKAVVYNRDDIVIDNPPFSIFAEIVSFYLERKIKFFLFGPGMTILSAYRRGASIVVTGCDVKYANGANVPTNYATNILGNVAIMTAPELNDAIESCPSQTSGKKKLASFEYPVEFLNISSLQTMAGGGVSYSVRRNQCQYITKLDAPNMAKKIELFGGGLLVSAKKGNQKRRGVVKATAQRQQRQQRQQRVELSERERIITEEL